jgi:phosphoglycerol transferase MdoB-like AlkP superfamily enzyme
LLYTFSRLLFLAFNFHSYQRLPLQQLLLAFAVGLRFDIAAICRINSPFIVLSMLPFAFIEKRSFQRFLKFVFLLTNVPFLMVNIIDYEYLKFTGQRSSLSLLDMGTDIPSQIGQLSYHYWYLAAISALFILALYKFTQDSKAVEETQTRRLTAVGIRESVVFIVVVSLAVIGGRGGWQHRRLTTALAEVSDKESLAQLALNSTYTLINSQRKCDAASLTPLHYFPSDAALKQQLPSYQLSGRPGDQRHDNIVIIIVESLSAEYTGVGHPGRGYTPFLDSLARKGIFFKNSFADGRRSIDAPPSILAGLPHLRDETFYCTQFKHFHGLGSILKQHGYNTSFFHGGRNGTMSFDTFSLRMGFDNYYGLTEYPDERDSDGVWGIYDEPFLQYMARQLNQRPQPFASVVFTLSTHNPYKVPPQYQNQLPQGTLPIHRSVAYFDLALKNFFAAAEKMPWYKNTLFVITGDHIGPSETIPARMIDSYRVPIVFFHPGRTLPRVDRERVVQHVDIEASLLDYLGIAAPTLPFGHTIFDPSYPGTALGQKAGDFWITGGEYYLETRLNESGQLFRLGEHNAEPTDNPAVQARLENRLHAYLQWFNNGLAQDSLYH